MPSTAIGCNSPRADLSFDRRDSAPGVMKAGRHRRQLQLGRRPAARGAVVRHGDLRDPRPRPQHAAPGPAAQRARHLRRPWATRSLIDHLRAARRHRRSSCCRSTPSCRTAPCWRRGCATTGATTRLGFFAPEPRYLSDGTLDEMRIAVRRLHAAGIELILDVVYNHTAEGSELGPTLSFRGLDNASYYRPARPTIRATTSTTPAPATRSTCRRPRVLQMVMDSLRYWVTAFHVDGFRFDLGVTLGRESVRLRSRARASSMPSGRTRCCRR